MQFGPHNSKQRHPYRLKKGATKSPLRSRCAYTTTLLQVKQGRTKSNLSTTLRRVSKPHTHHASDEAPLLVVFLAKARHIWLNYVEQLGHDLQASACAVVSTHACSLLGRPLLHENCSLTTAVHDAGV